MRRWRTERLLQSPFAAALGGTFFFIDPEDDMFVIVLMASPSQRGRIQTEAKRLIYPALGR